MTAARVRELEEEIEALADMMLRRDQPVRYIERKVYKPMPPAEAIRKVYVDRVVRIVEERAESSTVSPHSPPSSPPLTSPPLPETRQKQASGILGAAKTFKQRGGAIWGRIAAALRL